MGSDLPRGYTRTKPKYSQAQQMLLRAGAPERPALSGATDEAPGNKPGRLAHRCMSGGALAPRGYATSTFAAIVPSL